MSNSGAKRLNSGSAAARFLELLVRNSRGHGCLSRVSVVCCHVGVSASGWSLVQRSPNECNVSECDREGSLMKGACPTGDCGAIKKPSLILPPPLSFITLTPFFSFFRHSDLFLVKAIIKLFLRPSGGAGVNGVRTTCTGVLISR
jgi:hypothetical protein